VFVTIWPTGIGRENGSGARCAYYSIQVRLLIEMQSSSTICHTRR